MLAKNNLLVQITDHLRNRGPDWHKIVERFKTTSLYKTRKYNDVVLASCFSEIHLRNSLEEICDELDIKSRVVFDPIKPYEKISRFKFMYRPNGKLIINESRHGIYSDYSEIDELLLIDGLPVLFEIKTGKYRGASVNSKGHSPTDGGPSYALRRERIEYLLVPLSLYYQSSCGYVLIIPGDQVLKSSLLQKNFVKKGGILVPFYTDRESYKEDVCFISYVFNL